MKLNELFDMSAILKEKPSSPGIADTIKYGNWTIKASNKPDASGQFFAIGFHDRNPNTTKLPGASKQEAINNVKVEIDRHIANDKAAISVSKITIDFNVEFTTDVVNELGGPTGVRFARSGDSTTLTVASVEYLDLGSEIYGTGSDQFSKLHVRSPKISDESKASVMYCSTMSGSMANRCGLVGNGRYTLEYIGSDEYKNQIFKLVFDSITKGKEDKQRLRAPGLVVAVS